MLNSTLENTKTIDTPGTEKTGYNDENEGQMRLPKEEAVTLACELLARETSGVLCTLSSKMDNFPFGSVTHYCLDENGWPVIRVSRLAQHYKNMTADPRVSLLIRHGAHSQVLETERLTWMGLAEKVEDKAVEAHYFRFFPKQRHYSVHDFEFFRLKPVRARYIGGFGKIFWLNENVLTRANPFINNGGQQAIDHMNKDHQKALSHYLSLLGIETTQQPVMVGVDNYGIHMRIQHEIVRLTFPEPLSEHKNLRQMLVDLARR